jgi:dTDP-4-dehydrorhamnose reductase
VMAAGGKPLVVRTSWIYGAHGKNFFLTMRRLARVNVRLRVVADQHGAPTSSLTLAQALTRLAWVLHEGGHDFQTNVAGIYHLAAEGQTTWHGFAQAIVEGLRQREAIPCEDVEAIATADFPTPAHRPMHSVLASGLFRRTFLFGLEDWHTGLDGVWRQLDQEA